MEVPLFLLQFKQAVDHRWQTVTESFFKVFIRDVK